MPTPPASPQAARAPSGVNLGGVLASLALVALLAGVVIPTFFGRHEVTLDNAAILLARDLRSVQNRAAHLGQPATLRFDAHGWCAYDVLGRPLTRFASSERIERRLDADAVFEGVTLERIEFGPEAELRFDASGHPDRGGALEVVYRGERRRLSLVAADGRVTLEGLERDWTDTGL